MKKVIIPIILCVLVFVNFFFANANTENNKENIQEESEFQSTEEILEFDKNIDYTELMITAAYSGDLESGYEYERLRNLKKQYLNMNDDLTFDNLYLLSKIVETEAGSNWLTEEHRQMVASVVINRVNSPEFPNTLYEVVYQKGQYAAVGTNRFKNVIPSEKVVRSSMIILKNGSIAPPNVVFQAEFVQGKGIYKKITDKVLGTTYFCYSNNQSLYR